MMPVVRSTPPSPSKQKAGRIGGTLPLPRYANSRNALLMLGCLMVMVTIMWRESSSLQTQDMKNAAAAGAGSQQGTFLLEPQDTWIMEMDSGREMPNTIFNGDALAHLRHPFWPHRDVPDEVERPTRRSSPSIEMDEDLHLEWHFHGSMEDPSKTKKKDRKPEPHRRMLLAQLTTSSERAEKLFDLTKPLTMAYGERWQHDVVFLDCMRQSTKHCHMAQLLQVGYQYRDFYDQVMILEPHVLMNDFTQDISTLVDDHQLVSARRRPGVHMEHTSSLLSAVSVWNLRHLLVPRVSATWNDLWSTQTHSQRDRYLEYAVMNYESEVYSRKVEMSEWQDRSWVQFEIWRHNENDAEKLLSVQTETKLVCDKYHLDCKRKLYRPDQHPMQAEPILPPKQLHQQVVYTAPTKKPKNLRTPPIIGLTLATAATEIAERSIENEEADRDHHED